MLEGEKMPTNMRKRGCSSSSSRIHQKRAIVAGKIRVGLVGSRSMQPVSARRLAASLWEMKKEIPLEVVKQSETNMVFKREKMQSGWDLHSDHSPPPHTPTLSEVDQSGRRTPSISQRLWSAQQNNSVYDSITFMERPPTSNASFNGSRNRLHDVSNALTTSKELLKIMNRTHQPSSIMSLISALHAQLQKARMHLNNLMKHQAMDNNLINCLAQENLSWKNKQEHEAIEAAIASIANELDVERKLRRRLEKKLTGMKSSFMKTVKQLESEKRAREITEQVCDELARSVGEDRAQVEKLRRECVRLQQEAEKEREMFELEDKMREGRLQMKLSEAKHHQLEEKSTAIAKLRKQLQVFLGAKRDKDKHGAAYLIKTKIQDDRQVEDYSDSRESSSDHHLMEVASKSKVHKWTCRSPVGHEIKARNSISGQASRRSTTLQRTISFEGDGLERQRFLQHLREAQRGSYLDVKGLSNHVLPSPRIVNLQSISSAIAFQEI